MEEIGLFPLGLVLLPGERVPLHIFEPRYRELIGECLDEDREFGLVLGGESSVEEIGTTAAVVAVIDRFEDGRLNIVVEGRERFRILAETSGRSFRTARSSRFPTRRTRRRPRRTWSAASPPTGGSSRLPTRSWSSPIRASKAWPTGSPRGSTSAPRSSRSCSSSRRSASGSRASEACSPGPG